MMIPTDIKNKLRHSKWQDDLPNIDMNETQYDDDYQTRYEESTAKDCADGVTKNLSNVKFSYYI